ncbi:MAG: hypothetical protein AAGA86_16160, partial [Bacteroidota bacterium]
AFCEENGLTMVGGLDFHGYGKVCSLHNALKIPNWNQMDDASKRSSILDVLKNGTQENIKVLLYKDRPFYPKTHLFLRPFANVINYFRTLNVYQVLSWIFWLLPLLFMGRRIQETLIPPKAGPLILGMVSAFFLMGLAILYHFREKAVSEYNDIYGEYSSLLGPIGLALGLYALLVGYFRMFRNFKAISK